MHFERHHNGVPTIHLAHHRLLVHGLVGQPWTFTLNDLNMARSLPLASILGEAILCYAQNGEPLRPEQGYPLCLLIPGWEGDTCIKWLRRLRLGTLYDPRRNVAIYGFDAGRYSTPITMVMEAKSVITFPSGGEQMQPGFLEIRGLAWSGRGRITAVEVSMDGGRSWRQAALQDPVLPNCHTRFHVPWWWNREHVILQSRCLDETGYRQPDRATLVAARGVNSVYHYNAIQSWHIAADGQVSNVHP